MSIPRIAKLANVSLGTVDRALHNRGRISEETRSKILRIAEELGYQTNPRARALAIGHRQFRIGVCIPRALRQYFDSIYDGIESELNHFSEFRISLVNSSPEQPGDSRHQHIAYLLQQDIQALIVCPGDSHELTELIVSAKDAGIPVIFISSDAPANQRTSVVWVDPELLGRIAGELMARFLGGRGQVAVVTGNLSNHSHSKRAESFARRFEEIAVKGRCIETVEGHDDPKDTFEKVSVLLRRKANLKGIYVATGNCIPVCEAIDAQRKASGVQVIATDFFPEMVPYFERQMIVASVYQRPYWLGRYALQLALKAVLEKKPLQPSYLVQPQVILASNMHLAREYKKS
ncbi:LacI family transcriptional regulator [Edaphobacter acidisoli]|uniref:LacI family transcriptional regulator n=1 Tax=Edaphobacter acidisoli TaxID=2040573 RepID=A0A916W485_9BACT|nr:substrate-binding domain-containing protein [Edaphobacter acidisoli]GGA64970.1 LacI family transcriptional regulator [Edaphobacter acidisoli]